MSDAGILRAEVAPTIGRLRRHFHPGTLIACQLVARADDSHRRWTGEATVGSELPVRYLTMPCGPRYYTAGSPGLVAGVRYTLLRELGVPFSDIKIELFTGY